MKKILLISDSHSFLDDTLTKFINQADEVWHAGDIGNTELCKQIEKQKPLKAVWGNIDGTELRNIFAEHLVFNCENVKVYMTHIGGYPGKYNPEAKKRILSEKPGLFICGHSHILKVIFDKENKLLHMNPGSCGREGFHKVKTAIRFVIEGADIKNLEVIELGLRSG